MQISYCIGKFFWINLNDEELKNWKNIIIPCFLEVDLEYSEVVHGFHDFPLALEIMKIASSAEELIPFFFNRKSTSFTMRF